MTRILGARACLFHQLCHGIGCGLFHGPHSAVPLWAAAVVRRSGHFPLCDDRRRASVAGWIGTGACDCNGCDYGDVWRHRSGCARGGAPDRLSREVYVTAALLSAMVFIGGSLFGSPREIAITASLIAGFVLRGAAIHWGWSLPRYKPRPGQSTDESKR